MELTRLSEHVLKAALPTPTLPPADETNSYVVFDAPYAVIVDAGSDDPEELSALLQAVERLGVSSVIALIATHHHRDHIAGMRRLQEATQANIYVHTQDYSAASEHLGLGEPLLQRLPDHFRVGQLRVDVQHAPGHTKGHVHILVGADSVILVGDHLAGGSSVWIGPPDGHMASYYTALDKIMQSGCVIAGPGHGHAVENAAEAAQTLKDRRLAREAQITTLLQGQWLTAQQLANEIYAGTVPPVAMWAAEKTVESHLEHLLEAELVKRKEDPYTVGFLYTSVRTESDG